MRVGEGQMDGREPTRALRAEGRTALRQIDRQACDEPQNEQRVYRRDAVITVNVTEDGGELAADLRPAILLGYEQRRDVLQLLEGIDGVNVSIAVDVPLDDADDDLDACLAERRFAFGVWIVGVRIADVAYSVFVLIGLVGRGLTVADKRAVVVAVEVAVGVLV